MRINQFIAKSTTLSRRAADKAIEEGRVLFNGVHPGPGQTVTPTDTVTLDGQAITPDVNNMTIVLNKPASYVCSRQGQGSKTVYDLLPQDLHHLKSVGRLDKDSSGLLLMTTDGQLANELTHPRYQKTKVYEVRLNHLLEPIHQQMISDHGIDLFDGSSKLQLQSLDQGRTCWQVTMQEGRNRQIRRTFTALGYAVTGLHRTGFGPYHLNMLAIGKYEKIK
ncbi:rRNA pseudouridine synthase [Candidatus Saccharibacteria bacterium]|nr:rRNA pseudouridine synthase [Candidatus Saccharibacteria bacterium]